MSASQNTPLAGVIFDMDGVLCDSEAIMAQAACRMFAETYRVTVRPEDFAPFAGTGENRYLGGVAAQYGIDWQLERDKARAYAIYLEMIVGRLAPLPGVVDFVAHCRGRGLKLAVATSADLVKMEGNLREIGLPAATFDVCLTGSDVLHKKPDPEIFLAAARRLGVPSPACLVVEDAPNGVRAAKAAGSRCLGLTTSFAPGILRDAGADWIAADLAAVPAEVYALLGAR
ncbi:MAG: HAD-IA family hydrolase [Planctomycetes bacterium]|nr:HAD-IA family hydrolase [Planctomycetota bacterium]